MQVGCICINTKGSTADQKKQRYRNSSSTEKEERILKFLNCPLTEEYQEHRIFLTGEVYFEENKPVKIT